MCKTPEDLDLNGIDTVAVDLETYDPNLKTKGSGALRGDGFVCGVAIATGKDTVYFNISHSDIDMSLDKKIKFWEALDEKLFQNEKITKVFHNAMYDVCWIRSITGKKMKGRTLSDESVEKRLEKFVVVKVMREDTAAMADLPQIKGVPTTFFMDANKKVLESAIGYWNVEDFIAYINDVEKMAK